MLFNYIKIAFRNLFRQKLYAGINILGLSLGMSICILVLLFVRNEYQYDKWYENSDRIYRFTGSFKYDGEVEPTALSPRPLARMLADELPEVEAATHVLTAWNEWLVKSEGIEFYTDQYARVDSTFFDVFAMPFAHGNRTTIFDQPDQVVLSKDFAQRIFGEENPMGKVLNIRNRKDFIVAGVLEKSQGPSHFGFDLYLPLRQRTPRDNDWVSNFNYYTYARLNQPIELLALNDKVRRLYDERKRPILQAEGEEADASFDVNVSAQRLTDIYLHSQLDNEIQASGDIRYVYVYTIIAIIILLIACINFMNLSTARSARRAREVGVRKVVGASRLMSSGQFLIEALIQSFLALGLGFILVELFLPIFSSILEKKIYLPAEQVPSVLVICFFMALITGLLAGSYPAIFLSGFQPIRVLKGDFSKSKESTGLRKGLVILQFTSCAALILFLFYVTSQINYMHNKELGFKAEQVMVVNIQTSKLSTNFKTLKNVLLSNPNVTAVTQAICMPGDEMGGNFYESESGEQRLLEFNAGDEDFAKALDIPIKAGRFFSAEDIRDSTAKYVVNESFIREFGIKGDPVGQRISRGEGYATGPIVGVVGDFHWRNFTDQIEPFVFQKPDGYEYRAAIRLQSENVQETIDFIQKEWTNFEPGFPIQYSFLDDDFAQLFATYTSFSKALSYLSFIILFTALLGLFGLVTFMAEQRTKEIGIRKVLGASVTQVMYLLIRDFARLVLIASLLAIPIGWWLANQWIQDFAYQVELSIQPAILSVIVILGIALLTVAYKAYQASTTNPVNAMRYE